MTDRNDNREKNSERSPFHEITEAGHKLAEEAHEAMHSVKFEAPPENPGGNSEIANMLRGFQLFDGNQQQNQQGDKPAAPGENPFTPNPSGDQPINPFTNPNQPSDSQQAQGPNATNPLEQPLMNLLTQGGDATPTQQAAMGIGEAVMSGLFSALSGGDDSSSSNSDGSGGSDGSDSSDSSDGTTDASQGEDSDYAGMPAWMRQYAMSA